jgi:hypothetical protein
MEDNVTNFKYRAIDQAVVFMVDKRGPGTGLSPNTAAFPCQYQYSTLLHSSIIDIIYSYSLRVLSSAQTTQYAVNYRLHACWTR